MKRTLSFFVGLALLAACSTEPTPSEPVVQDVIISGTITNGSGGDVKIAASDFENVAPVNEDGTFSTAFQIEEAGQYFISYGGEHAKIHLAPGFELDITLDTEQFDESISFSGNGAGPNNYLAGLYMLNEKHDEEMPYNERYLLTPEDYKADASARFDECMDYLNMCSQKFQLDKEFVEQQQISLEYERGIALYDYEASAEYYQEVEEVELPEDWYSFVDELGKEDPAMLENKEYVRFMSTHLRTLTNKEFSEVEPDSGDELAFDRMHLNNIDKTLTAQEVKDFFLHRSMMDVVRHYGTKDLDEVVEIFKAKCKDQECIKEVMAALAEWAPLKPGQPAPNFTAEDRDGNKVTLKDLVGKVLYIDVWATWCGPCMGEVPHLARLEEELEGQPVEFVKVSIDENAEAWHTMISDLEMGGTQLLGEAAWDSEICENYKINGIPRFILIDAEGNIVDANAPRPSSEEIIFNLIEEALFGDNLAVLESH
jgi:thiol-disulfide isomerase/thioredoxin